MGLNAKQRIFVSEYAKSRNATQAAIKAGYSKKTAGVQAHALLKNPQISKAIEAKLSRIIEKTELSAEAVLAEIKKLAFVNLSKAYDDDGALLHPQNMPEDLQAALSSVETDELFLGRGANRRKVGETKKIKLSDKVRALEMLAKHFKLLTDVSEVTGKDGGPQVILTMPANGSEAVKAVPSPAADSDASLDDSGCPTDLPVTSDGTP